MGFSPSPGAKLGILCTFPGQLTFPRACACGILTDGVLYFGTANTYTFKINSEALSPVLGISPQRRLCVGQALGLRSAAHQDIPWPGSSASRGAERIYSLKIAHRLRLCIVWPSAFPGLSRARNISACRPSTLVKRSTPSSLYLLRVVSGVRLE